MPWAAASPLTVSIQAGKPAGSWQRPANAGCIVKTTTASATGAAFILRTAIMRVTSISSRSIGPLQPISKDLVIRFGRNVKAIMTAKKNSVKICVEAERGEPRTA
jgi:hypothetical protein